MFVGLTVTAVLITWLSDSAILSLIEICGGNYLPISRPEETGTNGSLVVSIGLEC